MKPRTARGFSLVEILVVLVIVGILAAIMMPRYLGGGKTVGGKVIESPKQRAQSVACINNLQQIHDALVIAGTGDDGDPDGGRPRQLSDLKGFPAESLRCPVGGEPYQYDPTTGRVWCVHPGHEGYAPHD